MSSALPKARKPIKASYAERLLARQKASAWSVVAPYWFSSDKWVAIPFAVIVVAANYGGVYIAVWRNDWTRRFYDAIGGHRTDAFGGLLTGFVIAALVIAASTIITQLLQQTIQYRWRRWLTSRFVDAWVKGNAFYQIERDRRIENADQRISEDINLLVTTSTTLIFSLLSVPASIITFSVVLWRLSASLQFSLFGTHFSIPGYMVYAAYIYSGLVLLLTHFSGRALIRINAEMQHFEADFRFGLVQVREHAEQIAFLHGGPQERVRLMHLFSAILLNSRRLIATNMRIGFVVHIFQQVGDVIPYLLILPVYLAGKLTLGGMMQVGGAFQQTANALSFFQQSYQTFASWRAIVNRLIALNEAMRAAHDAHLDSSEAEKRVRLTIDWVEDDSISSEGLVLTTSSGGQISKVGPFRFGPGEHWLVKGASGSGKSTLLRGIATLWPYGKGSLKLPLKSQRKEIESLPTEPADTPMIEFLPQRSYVPAGTLKGALCYPGPTSMFSDAQCVNALDEACLPHLKNSLHNERQWGKELSGGEMQRVAIARAMLRKAKFLFLDEATSALDEDMELRIYQRLVEGMRGSTIVSISHHPALDAYHDHALLVGDGALANIGRDLERTEAVRSACHEDKRVDERSQI